VEVRGAEVLRWLKAVLLSADDRQTILADNVLATILALQQSGAPLRDVLRDGEVFCKVLNVLRPEAVPPPTSSTIRLKQLANLISYKQACLKLGMPEPDTLPPAEWLKGSDFSSLIAHIVALCRIFPEAPSFTPASDATGRPRRLSQVQPKSNMREVMASQALNNVSSAGIKSAAKKLTMANNAAALFKAEGRSRSASVDYKGSAGTHSFAEAEAIAFTRHVNKTLAKDEVAAVLLPIAESPIDLFEVMRDGIIFCALIDNAVPGMVDMRCVHTGRLAPLSVFEVTENLNLAISAAMAIGCRVVNIGSGDIMMGSPHLVLGLMWQIVKATMMRQVNLKATPALIHLVGEAEDPKEALRELLALPPEKVLLRWANYQLQRSGRLDTKVTNFGSNLKDSTVYAALLEAVTPTDARLCNFLSEVRAEGNMTARATKVLETAAKVGVTQFKITAGDIVNGNEKLNMAFTAAIFNALPGLETPNEASEALLAMNEDDEDSGREERSFRMWINSLGLDTQVSDTVSEMRSGVLILQVMDAVKPGSVNWSKVNLSPTNIHQKVINCNYAVSLGLSKMFGFSLVGIQGKDVTDGNAKLILALTWQLMRYHVIRFLSLGKAAHGKEIEEADVVAWANGRVAAASADGRGLSCEPISSFKDPSLASGRFMIELLRAVQPRAVVDLSLVASGTSDDERMLNAKFALSIARKIGCVVFMLWEDVVEVKSKMMLVFFATIMARHQ